MTRQGKLAGSRPRGESSRRATNLGFIAATGPRKPAPQPMKGEELRSRHDPSVSDLLARRVAEIARSGNPLSMPDLSLHAACELALTLDRWDAKAAQPVLRAMMTQCLDGIDLSRQQGGQTDQGLVSYVTQFTLSRAKAGDRAALDEFAAWARKTDPKDLEHQSHRLLRADVDLSRTPRDRRCRSLALQRREIAVGTAAPRPGGLPERRCSSMGASSIHRS